LHRGRQSIAHRLLPIAATLGHDAAEERLDLLAVEREVTPLDHEVLALRGRGGDVARVAIAVGHGSDTGGWNQALQRGDEIVEPPTGVVDEVLHAAGGADHEGDVEADLAKPADVVRERVTDRPAGAASSAPEAEAPRARAAGGESCAEIRPGPHRLRGRR